MIVLLDEDLPARAAEVLRVRGYDVRTVVGQGWGGTPDVDLWPLVQGLAAFFVTADKGFGDIRSHPPGTHGGVLLLRPDREGVLQFVQLLERTADAHPFSQLVGTVAVATDRGVRIRRPAGPA